MIMFPTGYIYPVGNIYPVDNILYPVDNTISINFYCCPQDIKCCPQDISTGYNLYFSKDFRREGGISCGLYPVHHILYPVEIKNPQDIKCCPQDITCYPQDISTGYILCFSTDFWKEGSISCGWYSVEYILYPVDNNSPQDIKCYVQDITHRIYPTLLNRFLRRGWYILWVISCTSHFISCGLLLSTRYKICSTGYHPQDISYTSQQISEKRVVYPVDDILYITLYILWTDVLHRI